MKWLMYCLVMVNILAFAWYSQARPSLQNSHASPDNTLPDARVATIRLLSELDPIMKTSASMQAEPQPTWDCHTVGPFDDRESADGALTRIKEHGGEGSVHSGKTKVKIGYWVYLKSMADDKVERVIRELEDKGITDYHRNTHNELSLGIYNRERDAERRQQGIIALGYLPIVEPLYRSRTRYWVDVRGMGSYPLTDEIGISNGSGEPEIEIRSEACTLINT